MAFSTAPPPTQPPGKPSGSEPPSFEPPSSEPPSFEPPSFEPPDGAFVTAEHSLRLWGELLNVAASEARHLPGDHAQILLSALACPLGRDAILERWLPWLLWQNRQLPAAPEPELRAATHRLLWALVQLGNGPQAVAPLTILAFDHWVAGEPRMARDLICRVTALNPEYRLGLLLRKVLAAGIRPPPRHDTPVSPA